MIHTQDHFHIISSQPGITMAWHMTLVLVLGTLVLIIAQNHPFITASSRWTLEKQQLHHDGRAVGRNQLPLGITLMVGESKRRGNRGPPPPKDSSSTSPKKPGPPEPGPPDHI